MPASIEAIVKLLVYYIVKVREQQETTLRNTPSLLTSHQRRSHYRKIPTKVYIDRQPPLLPMGDPKIILLGDLSIF